MPRPPRTEEIQEIKDSIAAEVERLIADLVSRLPAGVQPTAAQVQALISDAMNRFSATSIVEALRNDVVKLVMTGRGQVKHSKVDLV